MKSVTIEIPRIASNGAVEYFEESFTSKDEHFQIDSTNISKELCDLPNVMAYYGDIHAQLQAQLSRKEENVKYAYSFIAAGIRNAEKLTENAIKEKVLIHDMYREALDNLNRTFEDAKRAETWWRTIQEKANILRTISNREMTELKLAPY